jgi:hypothetical protein
MPTPAEIGAPDPVTCHQRHDTWGLSLNRYLI